ncbi:hypothetical protein AZI86_11125 [Bdellovibrio bacteriovorus]|uniref:Glycosyltransferase RgtA/B/C/D-like domain-containing protein n=1 Tax=Bdellovibrio bacteriovorus TaxID=959 RepID=A0A150WL69_BDEBC|nr:hypothetical protein [Bdellovibrio bacteriovorus]KYG64751.1 hypothetical protein AZI86_11125 [Bdellovibrio bacteriovorus]
MNLENLKYIFLALLSVLLFVTGVVTPQYNWDIIGYTAASYFQDGLRGEDLRAKTYQEISRVLPEQKYRDLTELGEYRRTVATDPTALEEHMPFYTIRMAYIGVVRSFEQGLNISAPTATFYTAAFFAGCTFFALGLLYTFHGVWMLLLFFIATLFSGFLDLAQLSSPDSMAAFFSILCLLLNKKNSRWIVVPLTILPFIRTDFIILAGIFGLLELRRARFANFFLYILPPLLGYFAVNSLNENYGYLKIFNFTLIQIDPHPKSMGIEVSLFPYLNAYLNCLADFIRHKHFWIFAGYFIIWWRNYKNKGDTYQQREFIVIFGFVLLHLLLFPAYYQRFFSWCAAIAGWRVISWILQNRNHLFSKFKFKTHFIKT